VNVFDDMGRFWAEIADENKTNRQIEFLKSHLKPEGFFLDVACGTGRHTIPLSAAGYNMVGLDISLSLLKIGKQRSCTAQLIRGDMRCLPFKAGAFMATISMDTAFGYLSSQREDLQSLTELHRVLRPKGALVLDVFNPEQLTRKYGHRGFFWYLRWISLPSLLRVRNRRMLFWIYPWREYPSFYLLQKRSISPDMLWLRDFWVVYVKDDKLFVVFRHQVRLYMRGELVALLTQAGFCIEKILGDYQTQPFRSNSNRLILLAHVK